LQENTEIGTATFGQINQRFIKLFAE